MKSLKFRPILKTVIWGGEKIAPYKGIATDLRRIGESWELSGVPGDESVVDGGEWDGKTLPELIGILKEKLVGGKVFERHGTEFPLLVKFIDAREDLSIQVHPDDALAQARHGKNGKTEMWYVVDADEGAHLKAGFSEPLTPAEYDNRVVDNTLTEVLRDYTIHKGDLFFLPAGRVHAICAGSFLVEIQQTSDLTYRIYDYGRTDADGNPRELHTEQAREAIDYAVPSDCRLKYKECKNVEVPLVACSYFSTSLYDLDEAVDKEMSDLDSFLVVMCVEGRGAVCDYEDADENMTPVRRGETILVPASTRKIRLIPDLTPPRSNFKVLISHL